ncbi:MAG: hypothetical protein HC940_04490 [Acaryochloris sp. SU_5_25]|nr:hypothetical protein [Acaryochloris sp. SU_5_25]
MDKGSSVAHIGIKQKKQHDANFDLDILYRRVEDEKKSYFYLKERDNFFKNLENSHQRSKQSADSLSRKSQDNFISTGKCKSEENDGVSFLLSMAGMYSSDESRVDKVQTGSRDKDDVINTILKKHSPTNDKLTD